MLKGRTVNRLLWIDQLAHYVKYNVVYSMVTAPFAIHHIHTLQNRLNMIIYDCCGMQPALG